MYLPILRFNIVKDVRRVNKFYIIYLSESVSVCEF